MSWEAETTAPDEAVPDESSPDATPVCPHCLAEVSPEQYYCRECGESVGQLTGVVPFVNIRFGALFAGRLWRKAWFDREASWAARAFCGLCFLVVASPVFLIGLPFALWERLHGRKRDAEGDPPS